MAEKMFPATVGDISRIVYGVKRLNLRPHAVAKGTHRGECCAPTSYPSVNDIIGLPRTPLLLDPRRLTPFQSTYVSAATTL